MIKDSSLICRHAFINGEWTAAISGNTFPVTNPATGEIIGQVADCGGAETALAIQAAEAALPEWRSKTATVRAGILRRWHDLIVENADDLGMLLTLEQGKPFPEARGEIRYGATFIEWFAEEGKRAYGDIIPPHMPGMRLMVVKQPVGVVAAITPWNFPNAMITRKVAPALAAGCTVVLKPSEETPLSALALAELALRAGIPAGVLNIVTGMDAPAIGKVLTDSPVVRKLSFTGSTEVGKLLMRQSAGTV
ncbi:MAG: aldehyde dehydrogenase family protein, partial [Bacteroidota bacterium]